LKNLGITGLFIGHINKEGALAGPKVLEHLVDVILYMEGESNQNYRLLRSFKNRYASTHELGIFEMKKQGLEGVSNPSSLFLDENTLAHSGTMVCPIAEGSRIILVEVQALVVETGYGMAKRTFLGVDPNRVNLLIATMEKLLNIKLANKDIILNIVGGLKIGEPALDLAIVLAIISSLHEKAMGVRMAAVGEVGLTGEIRPIPHSENRLVECEKMGFKKCILPRKNVLPNWEGDIERVPVESLQDAIRVFLRG
jgi:DNA repair protein RadA/Sms